MIKVLAERRRFGKAIELFIGQTIGEDQWRLAPGRIEFVKIEEHAISPPTVTIDQEAGQQLMDELWQCGLRPSEGSGSAGALAATERHLKDMQRIVFKDFEK